MKTSTSKILSLALATSLVLSACNPAKKIESMKPLPDYGTSTKIDERQLSSINIPLTISLLDVQNQVNKTLNGLVYEDNNIEDGDNLMLKVWKANPIVITEKSGKLHLEIPIKVWAKFRYQVGLLSDERELNLSGVVYLNSSLGINNWHLDTTTELEKIDWTENPSISIAGQSIPLNSLITPSLFLFKGKLAKLIDENIEKTVDIKPYVVQALDQISKPMELSKEYGAWLGISPVEVYMTKPILSKNNLQISMGLKAYLETSVGQKPSAGFDKTKLVAKVVDELKGEFVTNIAAFCTYKKAAELVQQNFVGKTFGEGKNQVKVNQVDLWGREGKMVIALNLSGSINGDVYLQGVPVYHPESQEIIIEQVDFVLDSKERLHKIGDWLVHGLIVKKIQENCKFNIASQLQEGQKMANQYLKGYEPVKGIKISGNLDKIEPSKIILTPGSIVALVLARGKVEVKVEGMK